ncbi:hypothetical protein TH61_03440 [Rufibacter sp. DG15C]|uniref:sugar phosphate isomerase/epimerase family protein n=1 Tax=Rufibacter sp. DG15C TaxID=1379909 RepID=UPI00078D2305|nr:sugar phosphate isomerase/epimerase [Rufibacter sp. DG15C]AMM50427.1 hypothetical protein TH61_03440 [Rufibacter sp. DG15C]
MNHRRHFLQQLGLAAAGLALAPNLLSSCASSGQSTSRLGTGSIKTVGLQLYTLRNFLPTDPKGVIAKVARAGYQDVETYGYSVKDGYWGLTPREFKDQLLANNLLSTSGHYDFAQYIKDGHLDIVKQYIEAAHLVRHSSIVVPWLPEEVRTNPDAYKNIANKINIAAELCKAANLKLAYHNHDFEFMPQGTTTGYDILLKETDPALVNFEADLFWMVRAGKNPMDLFKQHPGRFVLWHVKDMDKANPNLNTEIGRGSIPYQEIFKQAKLSGVHRVFVEQENFAAAVDPFQSIRQSHDYVKNTLLS